jgi:hypothetical protein
MSKRRASCLGFTLFLVLAALAAAPARGQGSGFTDVTAAAGVTFSFGGVLGTPQMQFQGGGTEGDFNNDGWPDLFIVGGGGKRDKLFINDGNGTFTDMATPAGLTTLYRGGGANAADYDKDGDLDIYVSSFGDMPNSPINGKHKLWRNNGNLTFTNVAVSAGVNSTGTIPDGYGAAWGDYDLDGDLDLWVGGWWLDGTGFTPNNRLFKNNLAETGTADFTDVTATLGLFTQTCRGFGAVFADMDGDRWPELLVSGDFGTSQYYKNNGDGTLTEQWPVVPGETKVQSAMGTCIGDFNRDGLMDWFITAIYPAWLGEGASGNRLYMNLGGGQFQSLPESAGVNDGGWGWGTSSIDFDNDGWLDLVMTDGFAQCDGITLECFNNEPSYLFHNNGDNTFTEVHAAQNLTNLYQGRGLITFDYDRDGDMDVVILSNPVVGAGDDPATGNVKLYRNDLCGPGGCAANANFLELRLDTSAKPALAPNGWGADVRVTSGSVVQHQRIHGGSNYLSRSQLVAHFGLGAGTVADDVTVTWLDGTTTQLTNVPANQLITIAAPPPPPPTWFDLGNAKAGSNGLPVLTGTGNLSASSLNQLDLAGAAGSSTATLVFGLVLLNAPLKGGVMVPNPLSLIPVPTSPSGATALPFVFPPGIPPGFPLFFQFWIGDPVASFSLSASNGLKGVTS